MHNAPAPAKSAAENGAVQLVAFSFARNKMDAVRLSLSVILPIFCVATRVNALRCFQLAADILFIHCGAAEIF
jgi:hypothetical protein